MIIPRLKGGLCNQMFTIAAAAARAKDLETEVCINYRGIPHVGGQGFNPLRYRETLYSNIKETDTMFHNVYAEPDWSYSPITCSDNTIIDGYFQSEKHFAKYSDYIKNLFTFPDVIRNKIDNALTKFDKKILTVHIRMGDYLQPSYMSTHFICNRDYYINALKNYNLNDYTIVVCTDDVASYIKYINIENAILCNSKDELEDLYMLSQADSSIMSNSTFSWWGAYLGKNKEKICAPSRWFGADGPKDYKDIYRDCWTIIDV